MAAIYKVLSALLSYPETPLQQAVSELLNVIAHERVLSSETRLALARLVREISEKDILEAQSRYVDLFDRTRALSLHLFEHVHGESRDRGQAMVSLLERYREAGLDISAMSCRITCRCSWNFCRCNRRRPRALYWPSRCTFWRRWASG